MARPSARTRETVAEGGRSARSFSPAHVRLVELGRWLLTFVYGEEHVAVWAECD